MIILSVVSDTRLAHGSCWLSLRISLLRSAYIINSIFKFLHNISIDLLDYNVVN